MWRNDVEKKNYWGRRRSLRLRRTGPAPRVGTGLPGAVWLLLGLFLAGAEDAEGEEDDEQGGGSGGELAVIEAEALPEGEWLFHRVGAVAVFYAHGIGGVSGGLAVRRLGVGGVGGVGVSGGLKKPCFWRGIDDAEVGEVGGVHLLQEGADGGCGAVGLDHLHGVGHMHSVVHFHALGLDGLDGHVLDGLAAGEEGDEQAGEDAPAEAGDDVPEREAVGGWVGFLVHGDWWWLFPRRARRGRVICFGYHWLACLMWWGVAPSR